MAIVGGFDIHRRQVTFDYLDTVTGQVRRGRISPACRETLRHWLERFAGREDVTFAVEGCTGWQFVVGELQQAGITALLAEPAGTAHLRPPGYLSHQGPPILRWALFEAGHQGSRTASPGHRYYADVAGRIDANRAALSVARKLARRSHHILRRLGDQACTPVPGW